MGYKSYHTSIKTSFSLGIEEDLLPASFIDSLPPSTKDGWKNAPANKFVGQEYAQAIEANLDDVHTVLDERVKVLRGAFMAFARLYLTILNAMGKDDFQKLIRKNKYTIVDLVDKLSIAFDNKNITKSICSFLRITPKMFASWKNYRKFTCSNSLANICFKRLPQQVSINEIDILKEYLAKDKYPFWSIGAIWAQAIRDKVISMSRSTWYRKSKLLGLTTARQSEKKEDHGESVRAKFVNQIWHMDVSQYMTSDNIKVYVYTVMDNLSRKLVDCSFSTKLSAKLRTASLRQAIHKEFDVDLDNQKLDLICDGGSENNNATVHDFINRCPIAIDKKIALNQVRYSNNMVEATFKIMKQSYFKYKKIALKDFGNELAFFEHDYNYVRPHYAHVLYTPNEISQDQSLLDIKPKLEKINHDRIEANRNYCCKEIE